MKEKCFITLLMVGLLPFSQSHSPQAAAGEPVTLAASAGVAGVFLVNYAAGKVLDTVWDYATDAPNTRALQSEIRNLASRERKHAVVLGILENRIAQCTTKEEIRIAMRDALASINPQLAEHAEKIYHLERQQQVLWKQMGIQNSAIRDLGIRSDQQQMAFSELEKRMNDLEAKYPRWSTDQHAAALFSKGIEAYRKADYGTACQWFQHARAVEPKDAGQLYFLSMAYVRLGKIERAQEIAAEAVAIERRYGLPSWFNGVIERFQGPDRSFVTRARFDPIMGSFTPDPQRSDPFAMR